MSEGVSRCLGEVLIPNPESITDILTVARNSAVIVQIRLPVPLGDVISNE